MSVQNKTINKYIVSINDINDINKLLDIGITMFALALKDYSIGYEKSFNVSEINHLKVRKFVIINRLLDSFEINKLKEIVPILDVEGFIFEDVGLINVFNELKINKIKILYINHFNCNYVSVNCWLNYVDSVFVSNELTLNEYKIIVTKVIKPITLNVFGYNQVMYSRRLLLSNFYSQNNLLKENNKRISDQSSNVIFNLIENDYGTVGLSEHIFDGRKLLALDNVRYFYINMTNTNLEDIIKFINDESIDNVDDGFLNKATIYKLRGKND